MFCCGSQQGVHPDVTAGTRLRLKTSSLLSVSLRKIPRRHLGRVVSEAVMARNVDLSAGEPAGYISTKPGLPEDSMSSVQSLSKYESSFQTNHGEEQHVEYFDQSGCT